MRLPAYCDFFSGSWVAELELAPDPLCEPDGAALELEPEGCAAVELDAPPDEGVLELEPAPAAPPLVEPEPEGAALDDEEAPPLALSFFWMSTEVDDELEPEGLLGAAVVPEADEDDEPDGAAVEPEGAVVDELDAPAGARLVLGLSPHAVRAAAPNAMETASARVESFIWPPWLGYVLVSKDQAAIVTKLPTA